MVTVRNPKDFWSGLLFIAVGATAIVLGSKYNIGSAARMGPGYFPRVLGILLIVLGSILALRAFKLNGSPISRWKWRPTLIVLGSVVLFGVMVNAAGMVLSTIVLIALSSAGGWRGMGALGRDAARLYLEWQLSEEGQIFGIKQHGNLTSLKEPPVYPEAAPAPDAPPQAYWYYCPSARSYYPTSPTCPEVWVKVPPRPE